MIQHNGTKEKLFLREIALENYAIPPRKELKRQRRKKVTDVVCDDIYNQLERHGDEAVHLLDIWPTQLCSNEDLQFIRAKRRLGNRLCGWGFNPSVSTGELTTSLVQAEASIH